jgi:hypothetical protein
MDIDIKDIPGASLIASLIAVIGDLVLYGGELIVAVIMSLLSNIEMIAPGIQLLGSAAETGGFLSQSVADQLMLLGIGLLLASVVWRAVRVLTRSTKKRLKS